MKSLALTAALFLAAAAPAPAQAPADAALDRMVASYQFLVGTTSPEGALVRRVWADGRAMVVTVEAPASYMRSPAWVANAVAIGICTDDEGRAFFAGGHNVRVEITKPGQAQQSATRDSCGTPGGSPEG